MISREQWLTPLLAMMEHGQNVNLVGDNFVNQNVGVTREYELTQPWLWAC